MAYKAQDSWCKFNCCAHSFSPPNSDIPKPNLFSANLREFRRANLFVYSCILKVPLGFADKRASVMLLVGLIIGICVGVALTLLAERWAELVPSPSAIGIGMLIPASVLITFVLGGVAQLIWSRKSPQSENNFRIPLASGLIAGEAILAVVLAILAATGIL